MSDRYCVYEHVFPNGKKYIGISCDPVKRWRNGKGYETQAKIANAIKKYGWENVQHNILVSGISKEQAQKLEQYLIAELDTIKHGYNTTVGGENILGTYLSPYVLAMLRYAKAWKPLWDNHVVQECNNARYEKESADFWNEAAKAVTIKHGIYSATSFDGCVNFWHCVNQYVLLYDANQRGEDITAWREMPPIREGEKYA